MGEADHRMLCAIVTGLLANNGVGLAPMKPDEIARDALEQLDAINEALQRRVDAEA